MEGTVKEQAAMLWNKLTKYRYVLLVGVLGAALMLLPGKKKDSKALSSANAQATEEMSTDALCRQLEDVLSQMDGVGKVSCLLTCSEEPRKIYQTDTTHSAGGEVKVNTVLVSTGSGTEEAVTVGTVGPIYRGAVVVCDGADSAQLKLSIVNAVGALTGLGSDKIAVVKRKGNS